MSANRTKSLLWIAALALVLSAQSTVASARTDQNSTYQESAPANPEMAERVQKANARAAALLKLERDPRVQFGAENPNVLPESRLWLPKPAAPAFDWCNFNKVSDAHRQLTGDCWANAATEALECSNLIRNNRRLCLSAQPILDHLRFGKDRIGGKAFTAFEFFLRSGTATEVAYPYTGTPAEPQKLTTPYRAAAWGFVSKDEQPPTVLEVKKALLEHGPLVTGVLTTPEFHAYRGGVFNQPNAGTPDGKRTSHAVIIVGWDDSQGEHGAWKIKNTWGTGWGEQGFMWIAYGSNHVACDPVWIHAQSTFYPMPQEDFAKIVPNARKLPVPKGQTRPDNNSPIVQAKRL